MICIKRPVCDDDNVRYNDSKTQTQLYPYKIQYINSIVKNHWNVYSYRHYEFDLNPKITENPKKKR